MLLNTIKSTGQFHTTETFLAANVNRAQVEKPQSGLQRAKDAASGSQDLTLYALQSHWLLVMFEVGRSSVEVAQRW